MNLSHNYIPHYRDSKPLHLCQGISGLVGGSQCILQVSQNCCKSLTDTYLLITFIKDRDIGCRRNWRQSVCPSGVYSIVSSQFRMISVMVFVCLGAFRPLLEAEYLDLLRMVCQEKCPLALDVLNLKQKEITDGEGPRKRKQLVQRHMYERMRCSTNYSR